MEMGNAVAMQSTEFFPMLCAREFKRSRSRDCEKDALDMLASYKKYNQISLEDYEATKREIKAAPHDDAISNIMTKVRKRIKW